MKRIVQSQQGFVISRFQEKKRKEKKTYERNLMSELVSGFKKVFIGFQIASK